MLSPGNDSYCQSMYADGNVVIILIKGLCRGSFDFLHRNKPGFDLSDQFFCIHARSWYEFQSDERLVNKLQ